MPTSRPKINKRPKHAAIARRPVKPGAKLSNRRSRAAADEIGEIVRMRAEAEAAIAEARKSHERLRQAIEILPQGIVFLDADGRYILWNKKYSEIYSRSSDLFERGARLQDTIRIGVERGDYPEAIGREEEWLAERLARLSQPGERHEQTLADGRCILIEERLTEDGGVIGLRVDITELKQREASFRLLFDSNPVPMIVCALDDERILSVNDAAIAHYGYSRAEFEKLTIGSVQAFELPAAMGRRPLERRIDSAHLEARQGRWNADRPRDLFAPARLCRPSCGVVVADGHHRAQARRGAARLHGAA